MDIFEEASRKKLRFNSPSGLLNTEDLWHLPLRSTAGKANLNDIGKALNKRIRETEEEDLVKIPGKASIVNIDILALEIIKRVIAVLEAENAEKADAVARKEKKQALMALLQQKQTEALSNLTMEQIQEQINSL